MRDATHINHSIRTIFCRDSQANSKSYPYMTTKAVKLTNAKLPYIWGFCGNAYHAKNASKNIGNVSTEQTNTRGARNQWRTRNNGTLTTAQRA